VEALTAGLFILGEVAQTEMLLPKFKWAHVFLEMNREPLQEYAAAKSSAEVVRIQQAYMPD